MLFIDDEKISAPKLAELFKVDLNKIVKKPSFRRIIEHVHKDKIHPGVIKLGEGIDFRSKFRAVHPEKKMEVEIRYAKSNFPKKVGDKSFYDYQPRYVSFPKETLSVKKDPELALFYFLHPNNILSPLSNGKTGKYTFIDTAKETLLKMNNLSKLEKALSHAKNIDEVNMRILAKGLRISRVDEKEEDLLRAELMEFAVNPVTMSRYIDAMESSLTLVEGKIINLIDKGVLQCYKIGSARQWKWAAGNREGEPVGPQILNPTQDAKNQIINYILSNLGQYNNDLNDVTSDLSAKKKAEEFLKSQNEQSEQAIPVPDYLKVSHTASIGLPDPNNNEDVKSFVDSQGYKKIPAHVKQLKEALLDGSVNADNIFEFMSNIFDKKD